MKGKKGGSGSRNAGQNMAESVEQIVDKVVSQVLESQVAQMKSELVRRVLEELSEATGTTASSGSGDATAANLLKAISAIQAGGTQREILRALLDNSVRYSGRGALFVIKSGAATGWQGRGFDRDGHDAIKDFNLNASIGAPEQALRSRLPFSGTAAEIDPEFTAQFGAPGDNQLLVLPLLLKEKVAALVYADAGAEAGGRLDSAALELLVKATSAWLEVASLRKQVLKEGSGDAPGEEKAESPSREQAVPAHSDPFAAHAPKHFAAAAPSGTSQPAVAEPGVVAGHATVETAPEPIAGAAIGVAPATDPFAALPPEEAEVHRKAKRFARLLVDEIKLYNQAKVAEGRKKKDIYDRLRDDIEKSRITFQKRYGSTAAGGSDYFSQELVRSLAEDDSSMMGANFRRN